MKLRALLLALALCCAAPAWAHRFHVGIAEISYNERTGSTEVVHTYMSHDVEALLSNLYQRQFDMGDPDDQAVFRQYVEKQFWLTGGGKRLPLTWVGMTADTENITVFQELPATPLAQVTAIHHAVMSDFLSDQVNTVNIKDGASARTLTFDRNHPDQPIR
ncbi:DUF6702 family protein [Massilia sp. S19_KUP03_FR1]|uniref:DUF6702 family protein n=1 Tax=Massilia sp. S19_KUP03_FR1 TaxID=3025503 RepID=UPI002FCD910E